MTSVNRIAQATVDELLAGIETALPQVIRATVFLVIAFVGITLVTRIVRRILGRLYADRQALVVDLGTTIVAIFLWFGALLALLSILGMPEIAASLGTATGFVALGVSYALSGMIEDTVAGVYLLRDPDFEVGDTVEAEDVEGTIRAIELRKSRIELEDGDVAVIANADVESRWTRREAT